MDLSPTVDENNASLPSGQNFGQMKMESSMTVPSVTGKSPSHDHGNMFEWKLAQLFFMRAMNKEYDRFHLGTELEKFGGKFDDLILIKHNTNSESYLYLQAKHRLQENKTNNSINTANLLNDNKSDFSLVKYFHSYRGAILNAKNGPKISEDEVNCVICTNIDFNWNEFPDLKGISNNKISMLLESDTMDGTMAALSNST